MYKSLMNNSYVNKTEKKTSYESNSRFVSDTPQMLH